MRARLITALAAAFTMSLAPAANAVVVVGGDNGWEVSFDGNVNGFFVYEDAEAAPAPEQFFTQADPVPVATGTGAMRTVAVDYTNLETVTNARQGSIISNGTRSSRIRTGLLPGFFSFNVRSPEVGGLRGSARISFAPQIQNGNTKNAFGAQIDFREMFFNVDGDFGTWSVGRTLSLHQRHGILTDMTLFGVGSQGSQNGDGTTLGRIGYGYVYPQFNARVSYKTPVVNGFQIEVGAFDPSRICGGVGCATETELPRLETEATYATTYNGGNVKLWAGGLWQEADFVGDNASIGSVTSHGFHGGLQVGYQGFDVVFSGYTGKGLGTTLMLDADALDGAGEERDHYGFIAQGTYTFQGRTKFGFSYGENNADATSADNVTSTMRVLTITGREGVTGVNPTTGMRTGSGATQVLMDGGASDANFTDATIATYIVEKQSAFTFGVYHDVNSWLKLVAEYSLTEVEWSDGANQEADVFTVGSFFLW